MPAPVVAIIGAGQAGFQTAASLRDAGFAGRVVLIGDEPALPYQRPPLSKSYLSGQSGVDDLWLRLAEFYAKQQIDLIYGDPVGAIDRGRRRLHLASGIELSWDHLVFATGAGCRPLAVPGAELDGVLMLRTLADADALRQRLEAAREVVVVGAGFIGLEFASVALARGAMVHIIEVTRQPMGRVVSAPVSRFFTEAHIGWGAEVALGTGVVRILGARGRVAAVETSDGRRIPADLVLICIGVIPHNQLARDAGLTIDDGIVVDEYLMTSDSAISAIGDCANFPTPFAPVRVRLEFGAERGGPRTLRRRPSRRPAGALPEGTVVLERPGRSEIADRRHHHRPGQIGSAGRPGRPQFLGILLSRRAVDRRRIGQSNSRPRHRAAAVGG